MVCASARKRDECTHKNTALLFGPPSDEATIPAVVSIVKSTWEGGGGGAEDARTVWSQSWHWLAQDVTFGSFGEGNAHWSWM